jgi:hypothetical protein
MKRVFFFVRWIGAVLWIVQSAAFATVIVSQTPGTGTARWSQLWQDPTPAGNDLDGDSICWEDFTVSASATIERIEWWGSGASELGFQIEFWRQDPGTIAYQPLAVFDVGPGPSTVTPEARFRVTPDDYLSLSEPGGLTHFSLDLATPVTLGANDSANPRWFIGIVGLTHQAYVTWNWAQGNGGSTRTFQWVRGGFDGGGYAFRSLGEGRAMMLEGLVVPEPSAVALLAFGLGALFASRRRLRPRSV